MRAKRRVRRTRLARHEFEGATRTTKCEWPPRRTTRSRELLTLSAQQVPGFRKRDRGLCCHYRRLERHVKLKDDSTLGRQVFDLLLLRSCVCIPVFGETFTLANARSTFREGRENATASLLSRRSTCGLQKKVRVSHIAST